MVLARVPALACVCKELALPEDALRIVGQYLQKPTPTGAMVLERASEKDFNRDICRWSIYQGLQQAGQKGYGLFITGPAFRVDFLSRLQVFRLKHSRLGYTVEFCGYCHRQCRGFQCGRCFLRTSS